MINQDNNNSFVVVARLDSLSKDIPYIKAREFSEFPDRFASGNTLYVEFFGKMKPVIVEDSFFRKSAFFISFENFSTADACQVLLGKDVCIPASDLRKLPEHAYYVHDLIGSEVLCEDLPLGAITDVWNLPANDVYIVTRVSGTEVLVPALQSIIKTFDSEKKVLQLSVQTSYFDDEN